MILCKGHPTQELCPSCAVLEEIVGLLEPLVEASDKRVHIIHSMVPHETVQVINRMINSEAHIICDGMAADFVEAVAIGEDEIELRETF